MLHGSLCMYDIVFFFFNDTATTEIYTLSLHDALPILKGEDIEIAFTHTNQYGEEYYSFVNGQHTTQGGTHQDRKSTRLNSSHANISYAVFCLKKKKNK